MGWSCLRIVQLSVIMVFYRSHRSWRVSYWDISSFLMLQLCRYLLTCFLLRFVVTSLWIGIHILLGPLKLQTGCCWWEFHLIWFIFFTEGNISWYVHGMFKQVIVSHSLLAIEKTHKLHFFFFDFGANFDCFSPDLVPMHHMVTSLDHDAHSMAESVVTISNFDRGGVRESALWGDSKATMP